MEIIDVKVNIIAWVQTLNSAKKISLAFCQAIIPLRHSDSNQIDVIKLDQLANSIPKLLLTNKIKYVVDNLDKNFLLS